jgi:hypothetical protein
MESEDIKLADEALREAKRIMDNTDCREYRYQRDWSIGTGMFHVRCDDWEQFQAAVKNMETMIPTKKDFPEDTVGSPVAQKVDVSMKHQPTCPIHGATTVWKTGVSKKTGKDYAFWGCTEKMADGSWCTAKLTL